MAFVLFLKGNFVHEDKHIISRGLHRLYTPIVDFVVRRNKLVVIAAVIIVAATAPIALKIQSEFMPPLNEGTILYMPTSVPGMSLDTAVQTMQTQNALIKSLPEVSHVYGKAGRATTATDPAPVNMFETVISLKPEDQWRTGMTYAKIVAELNGMLNIPGMPNIWWMPIQTRIEMLSTGVRTPVGIKVLGSNLAEIEKAAIKRHILFSSPQAPEGNAIEMEQQAFLRAIEEHIPPPVTGEQGLNALRLAAHILAKIGASEIPTGRD